MSALALLLGVAVPARADRPFAVDDLLNMEEIGAVRFSPDGRLLLFERLGPYASQSTFGYQWVIGGTRSRIFVADVDEASPPRPLFTQRPESGYVLTGISPHGDFATYTELSTQGYTVGVVSLRTGMAGSLALTPDMYYVKTMTDVWTSGHTQMFLGAPPGLLPLGVGIGIERRERLSSLWRQQAEGRTVTASAVGSGRLEMPPPPSGRLSAVDVRNGSVTTLANEKYDKVVPSPDGQAFVALRVVRTGINPRKRLQHGINIGGLERRVVVFDSLGRAASTEPCADCDVMPGSVSWSPASSRFSFYARKSGGSWQDAQFFIADLRGGKAVAVPLGTLRPKQERAGGSLTRVAMAWLGTQLVVLVGPPDTAGNVGRADWHVFGRDRLRSLTADFPGETPELLATTGTDLIVLHDGDVWRVKLRSGRRNLTANIPEKVSAWQPPSVFGELPLENVQPSTRLAVTTAASAGDAQRGRLLLVDLASGQIAAIAAPSSSARFVAVSPVSSRAAVIDRTGGVTRLQLAGVAGAHREVLTVNRHLANAVGGTPIQIDHVGPKGDRRVSWILLPPGYRAGMAPLPTVVNVYPGWAGSEVFGRYRLDEFHPLNDHLLAARGYAVLYPSLPVDEDTLPRSPLDGLAEEVLAAVDAAVAKGLVDPDRLAVQGQSFGGYAACGIVGRTRRFKSAVVQAGIYDLISHYGVFDPNRRLDVALDGHFLGEASWSETGQAGLGGPPWDDPQRYLLNSPLTHVKNIETPIMIMSGDMDFVSTTQSEELFTALTRLDKDAVLVRYFGEDHVFGSPANIRDMWQRIFAWYEKTLGPPATIAASPAIESRGSE